MDKSKEYEQSIRIYRKATKEDAKKYNCKIGTEIAICSEIETNEQMFERLEKLHAQRVFEALQRVFKKQFGVGTLKTISDQLSEINLFIEAAETLSTKNNFNENRNYGEYFIPFAKTFNLTDDKAIRERLDLAYEYLRLKNNYYHNQPFTPIYEAFFSGYAAQVYGKYFLYKTWLEEKKSELEGEKENIQATTVEFRSMFVVDPNITHIKEGEGITGLNNVQKDHIFNIPNLQIFENGKIVADAKPNKYFQSVAFLLYDKIKVSQITEFLDYHYNAATNKKGFVDFIKLDIWDYSFLSKMEQHRKEVLKEWKPEQDKPSVSFPNYLKHDKPELLAQKLKKEFTGMTGKTTALFILGLKDNGILKFGEIKRQPLHKLIKEYWQSNIGDAKTVNDYVNEKYEAKGRANKAEIKEVSMRIGLIRNSLL